MRRQDPCCKFNPRAGRRPSLVRAKFLFESNCGKCPVALSVVRAVWTSVGNPQETHFRFQIHEKTRGIGIMSPIPFRHSSIGLFLASVGERVYCLREIEGSSERGASLVYIAPTSSSGCSGSAVFSLRASSPGSERNHRAARN